MITAVKTETHTPPAAPTHRTPNGLLVRPRQQFRYAFVLVAGGVLAQSLVIGAMAYFMSNTIHGVVDAHHVDPEVAETITHAIMLSLSLLMVVAAAFAFVAVLVGVKLSHRIYGPMVAFNRHIESLKAGYYNVRMNLRRTDDLKELRDALNGLAEALEKRHGTRK